MQSKLVMGALAGAGAVGLGAFALGMAQQPISGELDPPAGPVGDTTPSLADLQTRIDRFDATLFPSNLVESRRLTVGVGQSESLVVGGSDERIRLVSVIVTEGAVDVVSRGTRLVQGLRANSSFPTSSGSVDLGFAQYSLDVDVDLPLGLTRITNQPPVVSVVYRRLD
ncbi:MAG: hypothetical protein AAFR38_12915 [Planctomycetota bacterium]